MSAFLSRSIVCATRLSLTYIGKTKLSFDAKAVHLTTTATGPEGIRVELQAEKKLLDRSAYQYVVGVRHQNWLHVAVRFALRNRTAKSQTNGRVKLSCLAASVRAVPSVVYVVHQICSTLSQKIFSQKKYRYRLAVCRTCREFLSSALKR